MPCGWAGRRCSRKEADAFIERGLVNVDGKPARLGDMVSPANAMCAGVFDFINPILWAIYRYPELVLNGYKYDHYGHTLNMHSDGNAY